MVVPASGGTGPSPYPFAYLKDKGIGVAKAVKTVVLCARLQAWSRGDATTTMVTHAWRVGSRLEEYLKHMTSSSTKLTKAA